MSKGKAKLDKWDKRFLHLAKQVAQWSKDHAKVGAIITDKKRRVIAMGFNGFPIGVADKNSRLKDKDLKNLMVVHAEENAVLIAGRAARGGAIYVYGKPVCSRSAGVVIQSGIKKVVAQRPTSGTKSHWDKVGLVGERMIKEAELELSFYKEKQKH